MYVGKCMRISCNREDLMLIVCGFRPNFMEQIDCARVAVNVRMAFAPTSWKPIPSKPDGVVAIYQAWSGSSAVEFGELVFTIDCMKCFVMLLMVVVNVVVNVVE